MSKIDDIKKDIGWTKKALQPFCSNCEFCVVEMKKSNWGTHMVEKSPKCSKFGFITKKQATCKRHVFKEK